jgi:outer membrane protein OmpA-like peptidoglycan-associated protein
MSKNKRGVEVQPDRICAIDASTNSLAFAVFDKKELKEIGKINFEGENIYLKVGDAATVASLAAMKEILTNYPNAKFSVEGHTDSDGTNAFNQKLSEDRANAVKKALVEKGINANNLTTAGFGETKPIATNKTKAGKAQNRRTEVKHLGSK